MARFEGWLAAGTAAYRSRLWAGTHYRYDDGGGASSDSIMADQLAGQWYADATGLGDVVAPERVMAALRTVFARNVLGFHGGEMGAVNGVRPDGSVDRTSEQSPEVWVGTTYALAAFMLGRGLEQEAWRTARGAWNVTYNRGLWFRTPEATTDRQLPGEPVSAADGDLGHRARARPAGEDAMAARRRVRLPRCLRSSTRSLPTPPRRRLDRSSTCSAAAWPDRRADVPAPPPAHRRRHRAPRHGGRDRARARDPVRLARSRRP